jgi:DNA repair protein RecN (Recombination protein N)
MPNSLVRELYVERLGVIERAHLELDPGFVVLTGETGAGKTLLVGALELCLGREGVSARRGVGAQTRVSVVVETDGVDIALGRESSPSGRLRAHVNGAPTSADALRAVGESHIELLGQRDSLKLAQRSEVLRLLDESGGVQTTELDELRSRRRVLERDLEEFSTDPSERERLVDYLTFQIEEFDAVQPLRPTELRDVLKELADVSELHHHLATVQAGVESVDGDDGGALSQLSDVARRLEGIDGLSSVAARLHDAVDLARDAVHDMRQWADPERLDQERLAALSARVETLQRLARKYGGHLEEAFVEVGAARERRDALLAGEEAWSQLRDEIRAADEALARVAQRVLADRRVAAEALSARINHHMARVALAGAEIRVVVDGEDGSSVRLDFSPHPGAPFGPVGDMASGGELSRVLLAVSLATARGGTVAVYDEVDAGIGGSVAQHIGECLAELAERQQVLAVTHLASVAAKAHQHFVVERASDGVAAVRQVVGEDRVAEVARMLSGEPHDDRAKSLARRLLGDTGTNAGGAPG